MNFRLSRLALVLVAVGAPELGAQSVWNGGGGANTDWSDSANWVSGSVPANSYSTTIDFSQTGAFTSTLDSNYQLNMLTVASGAGALVLNTSASQAFSISSSFTDSSANSVQVTAGLQYTMSLQLNGGGMLTLGGTSNTYMGLTNVNSGTLADANANAFSAASGLVVASGAVTDVNFNETVSYLDNYLGGGGSVVIAGGATLIMNGGYSTTFPGVISGSGNLEKDVTGTLTLTGANTYTGTTVINGAGGTDIQIGSGGTTGSIASSGVSGTGTLSFDLSSPYSYGGTLSGALQIVQSGTGTTTLSGTNTYSGPTTINGGTLQAGSTSAFGGATGLSVVTVANGATLGLGSFSNTIGTLAGGATSSVTLGSGSTLTLGTAGSSIFNGVISGAGALSTNEFALNLTNANTYSGGTTITGSGNTLVANNATGSATGSGPITIGAGASLLLGQSNTNGFINATPAITDNGTLEFDQSSGTYPIPNSIGGTGGVSQDGTATVVLSGSNSFTGTLQPFNGVLRAGSTNAFGGGMNPVSFPYLGVLDLAGWGNSVGSISGGASGGGITLGSGTLTIANGSSHTSFAGYITGTGSLDFGGATMVMTGANNTYSGGTLITSGSLVADNPSGSATGTGTITISPGATLQIGVADTNGSVSAATITDNGTIVFARADNITVTSAINGTGGLNVQETGGSVTLEGANSYSGPTYINNGELEDWGATSLSANSSVQIASSGSLGINDNETIADLENIGGTGGPVSLASGTTLTIGTGNAALAPFTGIISGPGGVTINTGSNSQGFGGQNTYTGVTTMDSGEIFVSSSTVGAPGSISSGPIGTNTLVFAGNGEMSSITNNVTLANAISLGGYNLDNDDATTNLTLTGPISGVGGSITWCTNNVLALINSNTFTGGVDMREGTLLLGSDTGAGTGGIILDSGTVLAADGGPGITRSVANNINFTGSSAQLGNNDDNYLTLTGSISGGGSVAYQGGPTGSLTLAPAANTFTGSFAINSGTVFAANNNAFGASGNPVGLTGGAALNVMNGVTVNNPLTFSGAPNTLEGSGAITSPVTVDNHLVLAPSSPTNGPGNLTFNNSLTLANGGAISFDLYNATGSPGTGYSLISANTGLNITAGAGSLSFNLFSTDINGNSANAINFNPASSYTWTFLLASPSVTGFNTNEFNINTAGFTNGGGGTFSITGTTNSLSLNFSPVPEPSTWALIAAGLFASVPFALRRRRMAKA